jgi:hypothetical protein
MNHVIKAKAIVFCIFATALITSWSAQAETIYLTCPEADPFLKNLTVDFTNNTVNNKPATINATAIDWQVKLDWGGGNTRVDYYHIDRTAGTLTYSPGQMHFANGFIPPQSTSSTYSCSVGSPSPTKF